MNAMKTSLEQVKSLAESIPESYQNAPEYHDPISIESPRYGSRVPTNSCLSADIYHRLYTNSAMLLGSAPPKMATFPDGFLEKQNGTSSSLDQDQNVEEGMESLLSGMNTDHPQHNSPDDAYHEEGAKGIPIRVGQPRNFTERIALAVLHAPHINNHFSSIASHEHIPEPQRETFAKSWHSTVPAYWGNAWSRNDMLGQLSVSQ